MATSSRSTFTATFQQRFNQVHESSVSNYNSFHDSYEIEDRPNRITNAMIEDSGIMMEGGADRVQLVLNSINNLHWYERTIIEMYANGKSVAQLAKETGIPKRSLFQTLKNVKTKIKKEVKCSQG